MSGFHSGRTSPGLGVLNSGGPCLAECGNAKLGSSQLKRVPWRDQAPQRARVTLPQRKRVHNSSPFMGRWREAQEGPIQSYSGNGACLVSGNPNKSSAPATAARPLQAIALPKPACWANKPTTWRPAMLPAAAATAVVASAVARARVGNSSADQAPKTGVEALANTLHKTLPTRKPAVAVAKLRLVAIAVASVKTMAGPRRPKRSVRKPPATYAVAPPPPETPITGLIPAAVRVRLERATHG